MENMKPSTDSDKATYYLDPKITERIRMLAAKEKRSRSAIAQDFLLRGGVLETEEVAA